jgi:acetyl-CoA C-acetyltransferase
MMRYENAAIPAGLAWSSPFVKWQGSLGEVSSLDLAADVTARALAARGIDPAQVEGLVLGWTIPQRDIFYGAPTLAARLGAGSVSGPMISQACAPSRRRTFRFMPVLKRRSMRTRQPCGLS